MLMSLYEGDLGVLAVTALGSAAVPRLRELLFCPDPSGIFQPRCHVVDALAALGATDILRSFLASPPLHGNPIEHAGDVAVINAATRALPIDPVDDADFTILFNLAQMETLAGPIEQLGRFHRPEALSLLIDALGDDVARPAAYKALNDFGVDAVPALIASVLAPSNAPGSTTPTTRRRMLEVLRILHAMIPKMTRIELAAKLPQLLHLLEYPDAAVQVEVCFIILDADETFHKRKVNEKQTCRQIAMQTLIKLLPAVSWLKRREIKAILHQNQLDLV